MTARGWVPQRTADPRGHKAHDEAEQHAATGDAHEVRQVALDTSRGGHSGESQAEECQGDAVIDQALAFNDRRDPEWPTEARQHGRRGHRIRRRDDGAQDEG